jgi:hypothetical protein
MWILFMAKWKDWSSSKRLTLSLYLHGATIKNTCVYIYIQIRILSNDITKQIAVLTQSSPQNNSYFPLLSQSRSDLLTEGLLRFFQEVIIFDINMVDHEKAFTPDTSMKYNTK